MPKAACRALRSRAQSLGFAPCASVLHRATAMIRFQNRQEAGRKLAIALAAYAEERPIILALPRGGVPVAYEIARALQAPLDVWVVRKLGVPWDPELGVGAISENGHVHLSHEMLAHVGLSEDQLQQMIEQQRAVLEDRVRRFRGDRPPPQLRDRPVILVDDGIATGGTVRAAILSIRAEAPKSIVLAVPVASADTIEALAAEVNRVIALAAPSDLYAISPWYEDFQETSDDEVVGLLDRAREAQIGSEHVVASCSENPG